MYVDCVPLKIFCKGTPSLARPHTIAKVMDELSNTVGVVEGAEVCLEANPTSAEIEKLQYVCIWAVRNHALRFSLHQLELHIFVHIVRGWG